MNRSVGVRGQHMDWLGPHSRHCPAQYSAGAALKPSIVRLIGPDDFHRRTPIPDGAIGTDESASLRSTSGLPVIQP